MIKPIAILQGIALIYAMILLLGSTMVYRQHYLYTPRNRFNIGIHLGKRNRKYLRFSQKYNINAFFMKVQLAAYLPHTALCPIAPYSISILFSRNKSNTAAGRLRATAFFWWNYKRDVRCMNTPTTWKEIRNICAGFNDIQRKPSIYTQRCLRPLARRAASTARPPLVAIRARKPWVLARLRLFGW